MREGELIEAAYMCVEGPWKEFIYNEKIHVALIKQ